MKVIIDIPEEYLEILKCLESLLDKGYTFEMIQTVLEQIDIKENKNDT